MMYWRRSLGFWHPMSPFSYLFWFLKSACYATVLSFCHVTLTYDRYDLVPVDTLIFSDCGRKMWRCSVTLSTKGTVLSLGISTFNTSNKDLKNRQLYFFQVQALQTYLLAFQTFFFWGLHFFFASQSGAYCAA